jgi:hypothetical protein
VSSISFSLRSSVDHVFRSSFSFVLRSSLSFAFRSSLSSINQHQENKQELFYVERARRLKKNRAQREKKNRVRREKNDRARQLQKNHSTTQNELLKRRNLLKIEIVRRTTLLHDLKTKKKEREQKKEKKNRLRQSNKQFFEFFQCSHSFVIDLTMFLMNEKSFIDFSKKSRMIDVLIRSSKNAFINTFSFFQNVDVDSFIN